MRWPQASIELFICDHQTYETSRHIRITTQTSLCEYGYVAEIVRLNSARAKKL